MALGQTRRPGFTVPGVASAAARTNHQLGTAHKFTSAEARDAGKRSGAARRAKAAEARRVSA